MKYYLAEIYVTHRRILGIYIPYYHKLTTVLVEAHNWEFARELTIQWADNYVKKLKTADKYKYVSFTTSPI